MGMQGTGCTMAGQLNKERILGNFKPPKGYAREKRTNSKNYKSRPGMSDKHLDLIRGLPCSVCLVPPRSEAHHLKQGTGERGMGLRSTDKHAVPLCNEHHHEVEHAGSRNERDWFRSFGIDALGLALALWAASGDLDQMKRIVEAHQP